MRIVYIEFNFVAIKATIYEVKKYVGKVIL